MTSIFTIDVDLEKIVSDLSSLNNDNGHFTFLNRYKDTINIFSTMKNLADATGRMVTTTDVPCWWCRVRFYNSPIGCPIAKKLDPIEYHTIGVFCSANCVKSYILDNRDDKKDSLNLLSMMVFDTGREKHRSDSTVEYMRSFPIIKERPCWRLLHDNGGPLQRDEYFNTDSIYIDVIGANVAIVPVSNDYQQYNTVL